MALRTGFGVASSMHHMEHSVDPKKAIFDTIGDISELEIFGVQILVATYIVPEKTASGIYLTDKQREESKHQGKVGLVLKIADGAFVDGEGAKFNGKTIQVGDWVMYFIQDGHSCSVNGHHCRMLEDVHIRGRVSNPDLVM